MKFWIILAIVFALFTALAQVNCNFLIMFHGSISPEALSRLFKIIQFILPLWFGQFKAHPYALAHTSWPYDFFFRRWQLAHTKFPCLCREQIKTSAHPWDSIKLYFIAILLCAHERYIPRFWQLFMNSYLW